MTELNLKKPKRTDDKYKHLCGDAMNYFNSDLYLTDLDEYCDWIDKNRKEILDNINDNLLKFCKYEDSDDDFENGVVSFDEIQKELEKYYPE